MWLKMVHPLVPACKWIAATLGGGDVAAGGTVARISTYDDAQSDDDDDEPAFSSKQSLARWVSVRTRPATRMVLISV